MTTDTTERGLENLFVRVMPGRTELLAPAPCRRLGRPGSQAPAGASGSASHRSGCPTSLDNHGSLPSRGASVLPSR